LIPKLVLLLRLVLFLKLVLASRFVLLLRLVLIPRLVWRLHIAVTKFQHNITTFLESYKNKLRP
jgi:hypothetical protein